MREDDLTFVFTDIEGSTSLFHRLGDTYIDFLAVHHAVIREAIAAHDGNEVQTEGDAFFITFRHPADAVACCLHAQLGLRAATWPTGTPARVRMGIHCGRVRVLDDGDLVGFAVHESARVASTAHGGQVIVSDDIVDATRGRLPADAGFLDLGVHKLKDIPAGRSLHQLTHPELDASFPPPRSLTARDHNLLVPPTAIIGRDAAMADVVGHLSGDTRLVTLTGEGGIGKTRLAEESAWQLLASFRGGVWMVRLDAVRQPAGIVPTIGQAMGVELGEADPLDSVVAHVGDDAVLVVLDNLEHLLDGVTVISELLGRCPNLRVLATSRERLRLRGERRIVVDPLPVPATPEVADVEASPTAQLLLERARDVGEPIELDQATAPLIARICRQLDGLPLAVELAAARLADFDLEQIADRLETAIDLLSEGDRDLPPRQQALQSAIAWSEDLLPETDRSAFRSAAVFAGPFDASQLAAVAGTTVDEAAAAAVVLAGAGLARKAVRWPAERQRWYLLTPIRQYGVGALSSSGRLDETSERFIDLVGELASEQSVRLVGPEQTAALDRLEEDHDNIAAALAAAAPPRRAEIAHDLLRYFDLRSHWRQASSIYGPLLADGELDDRHRATAGIGMAAMLRSLGRTDEALAVLDDIPDVLDDGDRTLVLNLRALSMLSPYLKSSGRVLGDDAAARESIGSVIADAAAAAARSGNARLQALVEHTRATFTWTVGDRLAAEAHYRRLADLWAEIGDHAAALDARYSVASALASQGRSGEACDVAESLLDELRERGHRRGELAVTELLLYLGPDLGRDVAVHGRRASDLALELGDDEAQYRIAQKADTLAEQAGDLDARRLYLDRLLVSCAALGETDAVPVVRAAIASLG